MKNFIQRTKKIRITILLIILAISLGMLIHKRRVESALVVHGSALASAVWGLVPFLPPGDDEPANAARVLETRLDDGSFIRAEMEFNEHHNPWPTSITLTLPRKGGAPAETDGGKPGGQPGLSSAAGNGLDSPITFNRVFQIKAPFVDAEPELTEGGSPADSKTYAEVAGAISKMTQALARQWPMFSPFEWEEIQPGLQTATVRLRYGVRLGSREMHLVKMDPAAFAFKPWHEREFGLAEPRRDNAPQQSNGDSSIAAGNKFDRPLTIEGWAKLLPEAKVLINGGQYEIDRSYIGWLKRDGVYISPKRKRGWSGFFVSGPGSDAPADAPLAAVIDIEDKGARLKPEHYRSNVMQSLMLLDADGKTRVNNSFYLASRAAIAEDGDGWIWFIMTPGAIGLSDLATVLKDPRLGLKRVLCLDGGFEAQILWKTGEGQFRALGEYLVFPNETVYTPDMMRTLPSVISAS